MSSHSRSVQNSRPSASQGAPQKVSRRSLGYILASLALGLLFMFAAESHARSIEYMREVGVVTAGTITEVRSIQSGGRQPGYWIFGEYQAVSPSGRELMLPFRFNVTQGEYAAFSAGEAINLIYDPDSYNLPQRVGNFGQSEADRIRGLALLAAAAYALIGGVLAVVDWRRRRQTSQQVSKLRSAFGAR